MKSGGLAIGLGHRVSQVYSLVPRLPTVQFLTVGRPGNEAMSQVQPVSLVLSFDRRLQLELRKYIYSGTRYNGHHWEPTFCPLQRDVPNSGGGG